MKSIARVTVVLILALVATTMTALAQEPGNRELQRFSIVPDPNGTGQQIVTAHWTVDVQPTSVPVDLSTEVVLSIDGVEVQSIIETVGIDPGSGGSCQAGPPCSGSCGTGTLNGESAVLNCFADCGPAGCFCKCGIWIDTPFDPLPIATGQTVEVVLRPVPGAAPDNDSTDNGLDEPYDGEPLAWNREVEEIEFVEVAGGGHEVEAHLSIQWEGLAGTLNLDTTAELYVNGTLADSQNIPATADQIFDEGCFTAGCGAQCGSFNGIPSFCDPFLWWACGCGAGTIAIFPGTPVEPGDEIMVLLRPAPGALPELPGFEEDDMDIVACCNVVGVGESAESRPWRLDQNRPNPFNPMTTFSFAIVSGGATRLRVFDTEGRVVRTVLDRQLSSGEWTATWDGRTDLGEAAASGTYFYRLETPDGAETRRMTLLK